MNEESDDQRVQSMADEAGGQESTRWLENNLFDEGDGGQGPLLGNPVVTPSSFVLTPSKCFHPSVDNLDTINIIFHHLLSGEVDAVLLALILAHGQEHFVRQA